jgi:hypothetical protein
MDYNKAELIKAFKVLQQFTEDIDFFAQINITANESVLIDTVLDSRGAEPYPTFLSPDKDGFEEALFKYAESQNIKIND